MQTAPSERLKPRWRRAVDRVAGTIGRGARATDGVAATELAMLAPLLVFMSVATFDLGLCGYREMQVQSAAQAGAQYAILHGFDSTIAGVVQNATSYSAIAASPAPAQYCGCASGNTVSVAACQSACPNGSTAGTFVSVSSAATYNTVLSYPMIPSAFALQATATVRIR